MVQYVAVLQKLSEHCEFGGHLEESLCDRLVCVLKSEAMQKCLLMESTLTFKKMVEIASMETAAHESQQLSGSLKVNALSVSPNKPVAKCK